MTISARRIIAPVNRLGMLAEGVNARVWRFDRREEFRLLGCPSPPPEIDHLDALATDRIDRTPERVVGLERPVVESVPGAVKPEVIRASVLVGRLDAVDLFGIVEVVKIRKRLLYRTSRVPEIIKWRRCAHSRKIPCRLSAQRSTPTLTRNSSVERSYA